MPSPLPVPGRVVRISVAPVKSLGLVHPDEVVLEEGGVIGNRRFWLRDTEGALYAGKRDGTMMRIRPEWDEATHRLALTFPDGERAEGLVGSASRSTRSSTGSHDPPGG